VTQPTLSKLIQEIEKEMGVRLFERTTRTVRLTTAGEELVGSATMPSASNSTTLRDLHADLPVCPGNTADAGGKCQADMARPRAPRHQPRLWTSTSKPRLSRLLSM
jgi:hypothetical protein